MKRRSAFTEFSKSIGALLLFPLMPLILEFLCTITYAPDANRYLARPTVVITASILTAGTGLVSKVKFIFGFCLFAAVCLASMYGASQATSHYLELRHQELHIQTEIARQRSFSDKMDLDDLAGKICWAAIAGSGFLLIVERAVRHFALDEKYRFDWSD